VDVHAKLAEIRRLVEDARSMPMSASAVVNRAELLALIDELGGGLTVAFSDADAVMADRASVVDGGRQEADKIIAAARDEREAIISDTEVYRVAKHQADALLEATQVECAELRAETDEYVDGKLANFEITLEKTMDAVRRGRERLAGRTDLHGLTDDEVSKIRLPEHLEG
jgi:cell division septum initiation protein DivIVA